MLFAGRRVRTVLIWVASTRMACGICHYEPSSVLALVGSQWQALLDLDFPNCEWCRCRSGIGWIRFGSSLQRSGWRVGYQALHCCSLIYGQRAVIHTKKIQSYKSSLDSLLSVCSCLSLSNFWPVRQMSEDFSSFFRLEPSDSSPQCSLFIGVKLFIFLFWSIIKERLRFGKRSK